MPSDLLSLTASQAVRLIRDGELRSEALMDAYLDRIANRDPTVLGFAHFQSRPSPSGGCVGSSRPTAGHPHRREGRSGYRRYA